MSSRRDDMCARLRLRRRRDQGVEWEGEKRAMLPDICRTASPKTVQRARVVEFSQNYAEWFPRSDNETLLGAAAPIFGMLISCTIFVGNV